MFDRNSDQPSACCFGQPLQLPSMQAPGDAAMDDDDDDDFPDDGTDGGCDDDDDDDQAEPVKNIVPAEEMCEVEMVEDSCN